MMPSQRDRVLQQLRLRPGGVTAIDFLAPAVVDDGKPILRLPSRIDELRRQGFDIRVVGRVSQCAIYVLVSEPGLWPAADAMTVVTPEALFDTPGPTPISMYDTGGMAA